MRTLVCICSVIIMCCCVGCASDYTVKTKMSSTYSVRTDDIVINVDILAQK